MQALTDLDDAFDFDLGCGAEASRDTLREDYPVDAEQLWYWVQVYTGVSIPRRAVCRGHVAPFTPFARQVLSRPRPDVSIWHASRGGGKSFMSALDTHLTSRFHPGHATRILGGSLDQAKQIYKALKRVTVEHNPNPYIGNDSKSIRKLLAQSAHYVNGSEVAILACSEKSVRGDHVPSLKLDEVDEIATDRRESAMGMNMLPEGRDAGSLGLSTLMTSTCHRPAGPMKKLLDDALDGSILVDSWCVFEVLERCPTSRSGRWVGGWEGYENCPRCPIKFACHADRDATHPLPKAKRADGYYRIADLIQKVKTVGLNAFKSDYLSRGPKTDALVYPNFSPDLNVSEAAEYSRGREVNVSVDSGVCTGAVWFQLAPRADEATTWVECRVFADYYAEGVSALENGARLISIGRERCEGRRDRAITDPSGKDRTSIGPVVMAEYERAGFWPLEQWPKYNGSILDGIALVDSFVKAADGCVSLLIHPRCKHLIKSFQSYEWGKSNGERTEKPRDPQHPAEDLMDALRGGLHAIYPEGRRPESRLTTAHARHVI